MTEIEKYEAAERVLYGLVLGLTGRVPEEYVEKPLAEVTSVEEALDLIHGIYVPDSK